MRILNSSNWFRGLVFLGPEFRLSGSLCSSRSKTSHLLRSLLSVKLTGHLNYDNSVSSWMQLVIKSRSLVLWTAQQLRKSRPEPRKLSPGITRDGSAFLGDQNKGDGELLQTPTHQSQPLSGIIFHGPWCNNHRLSTKSVADKTWQALLSEVSQPPTHTFIKAGSFASASLKEQNVRLNIQTLGGHWRWSVLDQLRAVQGGKTETLCYIGLYWQFCLFFNVFCNLFHVWVDNPGVFTSHTLISRQTVYCLDKQPWIVRSAPP